MKEAPIISSTNEFSRLEKAPPAGFQYVFKPTGIKDASQIQYGEIVQVGPNDFVSANSPEGFLRFIDGKLYLATGMLTFRTTQKYTVGIFELVPDPDWRAPTLRQWVGKRVHSLFAQE